MASTSEMFDVYQRYYSREAVDAIEYINSKVLTVIPAPSGVTGEAILFGICAKETLWGTSSLCVPKGKGCVGDNGNGFGLGQVDKRWHIKHVESGDYAIPHKHFSYMAELLRQMAVYLVRNTPAGSADFKALLASYNAGQGAVSKAITKGSDPDSVTTGRNYAASVLNYISEFLRLEGVPTVELNVVYDSVVEIAESAPKGTDAFKAYDSEQIRDVFVGFLKRASGENVFAVEEHQVESVLAMRAIWSGVDLETAEKMFLKELANKNVLVPEPSEYVRPVEKAFKVSSPYGYRVHPIHGTRKFHSGVDYAAPTGAAVRAIADGKCTYSGFDSGYGFMVVVFHPEKQCFSLYTHNSANVVSSGQSVRAGQQIAKVGSTGASTGPHLHFELRKATAPTNAEYFANRHFNPLSLSDVFA